jgi:hypothetical protein
MAEKTKAPLARLLERYSDAKTVAQDRKAARQQAKERLVNEVLGQLKARPGESKDDFRKRLMKANTGKLLKHRERADRSAAEQPAAPAKRRRRAAPAS